MKDYLHINIIVVILICSIFSVPLTASVTDSLERELLISKNNSQKIAIELALAKEYSSNMFDQSIKHANKAIELAHKEKDVKSEAEGIIFMGDAYSFQNLYADAIQYYHKAHDLAARSKVYHIEAEAINSIGLNYYFQGKLDEALNYYHQALSLSRNEKISKEEGNALFNIGQVFRRKAESDKAEKYYTQALELFTKSYDLNGLAKTNNSLGLIKYEAGDYKKAVFYYQNALQFREQSGDKKGAAILYNNIGNTLLKWSKFEQAIANYQKALKVFDEIGMQEGIASCSSNIGLVYENLTRGDKYSQNEAYYKKALKEHNNALKIWQSLGNEIEMANSLRNIGNVKARMVYEKLQGKNGNSWELKIQSLNKNYIIKEYAEIVDDYRKSLGYYEKVNNKPGIAMSLSNLGKISNLTGNFNQAITYLNRSLAIEQELNNSQGIVFALSELGRIYLNNKNSSKALEYLKQSIAIAEKVGYTDMTKTLYNEISKAYQALGDLNNSLITYKRYVELQDSLLNDNNMKQIAEMQTQYETEKKEQQIQLLNKDAKLKDIQIKQKNVTIYFFVAVMLMVLVITVLLIKQNKERKKVNTELENRNHLITYQKKEITDSIHYARRIQNAVMPSLNQIKQHIPESFIYFKPRDIVSGDFYWAFEKKGKILIAAADCTGHGVPGAFMSMMSMSMLNNIVAEKEDIFVDEVLNELRSNIITSLHQTGKEGENKDGMDIALYHLDKAEMTLDFAGANNPLYIVRNGELLETKADHMPIGIHDKASTPFTKHTVKLQKGDMVYTFSDGYHDQFGGPNNKKFTSANFKKLLVKVFSESVDVQSELLHSTITDWMKGVEQIDDILVIGVRI